MSERPQNKHLKHFPKGVSGNPNGKPKQLLTKDKVSAILGRFATMTRDQLQDVATDPKSSMIEIMIASIMVKAAKEGDYARLDFLLTRSIGKVKDELELQARTIADDQLDLIPKSKIVELLSGD
jgi:hypothetical protein